MRPQSLPENEVHLWFADPEGLAEPGDLSPRYLELLNLEERARHDRYRFDVNRREYLMTRALVRTVLSRYAAVSPIEWRFKTNAHGRPEIEDPRLAWLRFNLSNTHGLVACVVSRDRDVGVDVEYLNRRGQTVEIADRFFAPSEVADLHRQPTERQRLRFFDYWTLKESYIKARGMGLAIPLGQFSFFLEEAGVRIEIDPRLADDPDRWQFAQLFPTSDHKAAVAISRIGDDVSIVTRWTRPLAD